MKNVNIPVTQIKLKRLHIFDNNYCSIKFDLKTANGTSVGEYEIGKKSDLSEKALGKLNDFIAEVEITGAENAERELGLIEATN